MLPVCRNHHGTQSRQGWTGKKFCLGIGSIGLIFALGVLDTLTGVEFGFSIFYLAPIALAVWKLGTWPGLVLAVVSSAVWYGSDLLAGHVYSHPFLLYWNTFVRMGFYVIVVFSLSRIRSSLYREHMFSRRDSLTGVLNSRGFFEKAAEELTLSQKTGRPISVVFMDCDNFKKINDRLGHVEGDRALKKIARMIQQNIRSRDIAARVGGDEFVILLPETEMAEARSMLERLKQALTLRMIEESWPVTFSIGLAVFIQPPETLTTLLQEADRQMYRAKQSGKDRIQTTAFRGKGTDGRKHSPVISSSENGLWTEATFPES